MVTLNYSNSYLLYREKGYSIIATITEEGVYMNIAQGLAHAKKVFGTREAVVCGDTRYTWNDFDQRTDARARGLAALGVQRGDRVAVLMLNCHRYLEITVITLGGARSSFTLCS